MPKIDDYKQAEEFGRNELTGKNPDLVASFSGAVLHRDSDDKAWFSLNFLNKEIVVSWPELEFSYKDSRQGLPIQQKILLLHYFNGVFSSSGPEITGEWIAFQDFEHLAMSRLFRQMPEDAIIQNCRIEPRCD